MNNVNDILFTIEPQENTGKDNVKKMQRKIISKATDNVKRIIEDKLSNRMGEC